MTKYHNQSHAPDVKVNTQVEKSEQILTNANIILIIQDSVAVFTSYLAIQYGVLYYAAFFSGLRVLIVDQWIETGGSMKAAIKLVEKQGASVVGEHALVFKYNKCMSIS